MDTTELRVTTTELMGPRLQRLQQIALGMGVVGLVLTVVGALMNLPGFFQSYLIAYLFWVGATTGSLALLLLHHVVGGGWGFVIRRLLEAAVRLLPLMLILFLPIFLGMHHLFEWTHAEEVAHDPILQQKAPYLNVPFFGIRLLLYFALWIFWGRTVVRLGNIHDERPDPTVTHRLNLLSAPGIIVYVVTTTFASVDWIMSLTPHWFSTMLGLLFVAGQGLTALALMLVLVAYLAGDTALLRGVPGGYFRDLGNLMLAMVMLWAYLSFSQYLITYAGNTVEEIPWFVDRAKGGWGILSLALMPLHFFLPFLVLLIGSRLKHNPNRLAGVAGFLLVMRWLDYLWWVAPTFRDSLTVLPSDLGTPLLLGGIWLFFWVNNMKDRPVVPIHDPRLDTHSHEVAHV